MQFLLLLLLATAVLLGQLVAARPQRLQMDVGEDCRSRKDCKSPYICTSYKCAPRPTKSYKPKPTQTKYCPTSVPPYTPPAGIGERCYSNYDCPDKLACIYNKCSPTETPEPSFGINLYDCVPVTTYGPTETETTTSSGAGYETSTTTTLTSPGYETPTATTTSSPGYETGTTTTSPSYQTSTTTSPSYESPTTPPYASPTTPYESTTSTTPYTDTTITTSTTTTTTTTTSPNPSPSGGGGTTCSWPGHCSGDTCRYDDECEQTLSCQNGRCTAV